MILWNNPWFGCLSLQFINFFSDAWFALFSPTRSESYIYLLYPYLEKPAPRLRWQTCRPEKILENDHIYFWSLTGILKTPKIIGPMRAPNKSWGPLWELAGGRTCFSWFVVIFFEADPRHDENQLMVRHGSGGSKNHEKQLVPEWTEMT